jgi:hypothetical protein
MRDAPGARALPRAPNVGLKIHLPYFNEVNLPFLNASSNSPKRKVVEEL